MICLGKLYSPAGQCGNDSKPRRDDRWGRGFYEIVRLQACLFESDKIYRSPDMATALPIKERIKFWKLNSGSGSRYAPKAPRSLSEVKKQALS